MKEAILEALKELRKTKERKFNQSVDFILNLKKFDVKKESVNIFVNLPHKLSERKICAFLNKKSNLIDTITKEEFDRYKDKKAVKGIAKKYDFFIASANLMPMVATRFGRYLGAAGKMPSPQMGILLQESEQAIRDTIEKFSSAVKIKSKEPSIKIAIGKTSMRDEQIAENIIHVFNAVVNALPNKNENINSFMIKLTMSKPVKIKWK